MSHDIRRFLTIVEDAEADVEMHKQAEELRGIIIKHFMRDDLAASYYGLQGARFGGKPEVFAMIEGKDLGLPPEYQDLRVMFGKMEGYLPGGSAGLFKSGVPFMQLNLTENPLDSAEIARQVTHSQIAHQVMLHELIHVIDRHRDRMADARPDEKSPAGSRDYYNSPAEFNAYFHNLSDKLIKVIALGKKRPSVAAKYAEVTGITKDFPETVRIMLTKHNDFAVTAFVKYLRKRNKRSMLKRLYKLHQQAASYLP